jgi:5-methylthioribose kinase
MAKRVQDAEYYSNYYQENKEKLLLKRKEWRENNKERVKTVGKEYRERTKEKSKAWRDDNKDRLYFLSLKSRAIKKGLEFNLEEKDVIAVDHCPVFGVELVRSLLKPAWNSASVDRIDNTKGYVKGNTQVMSYLANSMKRDATDEQLILFAEWVLKEKKDYNDNP